MNKNLKNLDQIIANVLLLMAVVIALLLMIGDRSLPVVKQVLLPNFENIDGEADLVLEFNDLMDRSSVEKAWNIEPEVSGNFSWYGKKLVFMPEKGFELGQTYTLKMLKSAKSQEGKFLADNFHYTFATPKQKILFYKNTDTGAVISEADDKGNYQAPVFKFDQPIKKMLIDRHKQRIYFLTDADYPQLYFYNLVSKDIKQLTFGEEFLNKNYSLSDDGGMITLSRINVSKDGEYLSKVLLWMADTKDFRFEQFGDGAQGLDAAFSPRAAYLLYRNADSNFELKKIDDDVLDGQKEDKLFIGEFSQGFGFHPYLPQMVFTEYDQEDVFSLNNKLVLFSGDGEKKYLDMPNGVFREASFSPDGNWLYFLFSGDSDNLTTQDDLVEARIFYLYKANLKDLKIQKITGNSDYSELEFNISNDSRDVLIKRVFAQKENLIDPGFQKLAGDKIKSQWWVLDTDSSHVEMLNIGIDADQAFFTF